MNTTNCMTKKVSLLSKTLAMCLVALFCSAATAIAQNVVKGTVRDASGEALPGVAVTVKGQKGAGAVTDMNGNFSINAPRNAQLTFTYVGMKPQSVSVGNRKNITISLTDDESTLNDVVVVGYGQAKKMTLTGAVSAMKGDELLKGPSTNISSLLGGKLPGLTSLQESGEPGDDQASLRIRGSQYSALYIVDGMPRSINDIDPNDVESVSVLKDGASAAVYGLNAAGGVIIVTTKQGMKGKPKVTYDGQYGVSMNANFPEFMDGPEFAYYYNLADYMDKLARGQVTSRADYTPVFTREDVQKMLNNDPTDGWDNVNYIDKVFGTGHTQKHNLSLRGGTDAVKYYVGMGYMNQKGNIDNFNYRRYNLRTNLEANVGKGWTINVGAVGTVSRKSDPRFIAGASDDANQSTQNSWLSIGRQAIDMHPYLPETYNGLYTGVAQSNLQGVSNSPLAAINQSGYRKTRSTDLNSNISVTYDAPWLKGLKFKATGSYDYLSSRNKNLKTPYYTSLWDITTKTYSTVYDPELTLGTLNSVGEGEYITESLVGQLSAEYTRLFGKHNVDALVLVEGRDYKGSSMAAYADHVPFAVLPEINFGTPLSENSQSGYSSHTRTAGYVFRLKYDYNNTYMAEFSGRYDGSYNFNGNASGKRWGFFPSFSAGWRISQEKFMQSTRTWLTDLKIRGSIGLLGNDGVPAYSFLSTYSQAGNRYFNGTAYSSWYTDGIANPNLTWSKTRSSNVGFDATFWDGLLSVEFDYFYNLNYDLLTAMGGDKAPSMGGYYYTYENNNRYSNYGLEWTITHRNKFNLAGKPFQYQTSVNMTYAKSKWLRYPDSPNSPEYQKVVGTSVDAYTVWIADGLYRTEEEIDNSAWYGSRPNLGDIKYRDVNGDGTIDYKDRMRVGRSNRPEIMMGINLGASWNGFDLSMQFTGGFKFDVSLLGTYYNGYDDNTVWSQTFKEGANSPLWLVQNSYSDVNTNAEYPRITLGNTGHGGDNGLASTFWMKNGNYLRLKTAQFGYTLPKPWMDAIGIERVRVFVEGSNLFTIDSLPTGVDPESPRVNNGYYPQQRTIMGGINVTF